MAKALGVSKEEEKLISYRYEAATTQGKILKGTIKAANEVSAERILIGQGLRPINVDVVPSMWSLEEALPSLFKIKPRDVIIFSRQLATLLKSGISLLPALEILQGQAVSSRTFRKIVEAIVYDLRSGGSFSQSIAKHPTAFSEIYCRTMAVGEQTGNMEMVLHRMADYQEKQGTVAKKVKGALTYPIMVLGIGLVVGVILVVAVMPNLLPMFESLGAELPPTTKLLMAVSEALSTKPLYFLIGAAVIASAVFWLVKQPSGRRLLDRWMISFPVIGPPTLMGELARVSRTMSVLITAGLSLQEIMQLVPQSISNRFIRDALMQVSERLHLGEGLSGPMSRMEVFPPLMVQMVAVGEESNTLDFTLGVVADFYEVTSEEKMTAMVGMIGPISTIFISLFVGFIAISVLMPMYALTGSF